MESSVEISNKRSIDQVQDISSDFDLSDCNFDEFTDIGSPDKKRPCWDQPEEIIKLILERRKNLSYSAKTKLRDKNFTQIKDSNSITRNVPRYNFQAATNEDGIRFYIKVSEKKYEPTNYLRAGKLLIKSFSEIKDEAEKIMLENTKKASQVVPETPVNAQHFSSQLWVDKYRPKKYVELLSDENVNRMLLYWLKLWDKIVFGRAPTVKLKKPQTSKFKGKFQKKDENILELDSKGFPTQRIALLSGPPGLGKTTLAHVAARHAGYNIVEINASDDRGPEAFREALLSSTQMRSVIDQEKRPNCLVLDEIDGAPSASIELLIKFIQGKLVPKGKRSKDKIQKENFGCKRPIICVCNDLYAPSLRPLRAIGLVINVPEITPANLAERLSEITQKEGLHVDSFILEKLAEKSACDVRACLGILQYSGAGTDVLRNLDFGLKDMKRGLFDAWKDMLHVPTSRRGILPDSERVLRVIKITHQVESDRLMQGIFQNYPEIPREKLDPICTSLEWFQFYDIINTAIMEHQSWILMPYTTSAFITWHLNLAGRQIPKISYPSTFFEVKQKKDRNEVILSIVKKTSRYDVFTLVSDVLPYLPDLLTPRLRSVNSQLYSSKEKSELKRLVNLMLDFGLSFIQERRPQGGYEYNLDPNIWDIAVFPDCKKRSHLAYAVKQIVIQELESARLQRAAAASNQNLEDNEPKPVPKPEVTNNVPNHLRQLNPVQLESASEKKSLNFFAKFQQIGQENFKKKLEKDREEGIEPNPKDNQTDVSKEGRDLFHSDVWYQYIEGYSNAVRRNILMEKLL